MPFTATPPRLIFGNSAGQLFADSQGFLRLESLPGAPTLPAVQQLFEQLLYLLKQTGWSRVLAGPLALSPDASYWLSSNWLPRAASQGGYRWSAQLVGEAADTTIPDTSLEAAYIRNRIRYQYFTGEKQAVEWLLAQ